MTDTKKLDRVEPSFFEGDDEGYWQADDEAGLTWYRIPHETFRAMCANIDADLRYAR